MALITNKNNPKVKIVAGKVNNMRIGFTVIRKIPKTKATQIAFVKLEMPMPGSTCAKITTIMAESKILKIVFT